MRCTNVNCGNIGAVNFSWGWSVSPEVGATTEGDPSVSGGFYQLHSITPRFDLDCDECSTTILSLSADQVCSLMNSRGHWKEVAVMAFTGTNGEPVSDPLMDILKEAEDTASRLITIQPIDPTDK